MTFPGFVIKYDRARFPEQQLRPDGTWGCRGCGGAIPKGRHSWCSDPCYNRYCPRMVMAAVRQRDHDICSACGRDCKAERAEWKSRRWDPDWLKRKPPRAEYDHIIPFSEGGLTVLENMRTLCALCHKAETNKWRKQKRAARRNE